MAPRGSSAVNGRVAYQQLETLVRQDAVMKRARRDKARAEAKGPIEYLWPLLGALCLVLLVAVSIHGFTDHTEMGHGVGSGRRGGPDDPLPYDSLDPGDIGAVWTTARVLRHFGRSTAADVRVAWDVTDLQTLDTALAPVAREGAALGVVTNDIVHVPVSWSKALPGNGGAGAPVVARTTHHASRATTDGEPLVPLDDLLDRFWRGVREQDAIGRERGLMLSFRDPRAVVPGLRAVRELIRRGRLHGPLIVDAEILPGPGGFLPQMAAVFDPDPPLRALKDGEGVPEGVHEVFEPNLPFPPVPGDAEGSAESRRSDPKNRQVSSNRVRRRDQADRPGRDPLRRVLDARRVRRRRGPGGGARGVRVVVRGRRLCLRLGRRRSRGWREPETHERNRSRPVLAFG